MNKKLISATVMVLFGLVALPQLNGDEAKKEQSSAGITIYDKELIGKIQKTKDNAPTDTIKCINWQSATDQAGTAYHVFYFDPNDFDYPCGYNDTGGAIADSNIIWSEQAGPCLGGTPVEKFICKQGTWFLYPHAQAAVKLTLVHGKHDEAKP